MALSAELLPEDLTDNDADVLWQDVPLLTKVSDRAGESFPAGVDSNKSVRIHTDTMLDLLSPGL